MRTTAVTALLAIGRRGSRLLHGSVSTFTATAAGAALAAMAADRWQDTGIDPPAALQRVPGSLPGPTRALDARERLLSRRAIDRHYLAVVTAELRRLRRSHRSTPEARPDEESGRR